MFISSAVKELDTSRNADTKDIMLELLKLWYKFSSQYTCDVSTSPDDLTFWMSTLDKDNIVQYSLGIWLGIDVTKICYRFSCNDNLSDNILLDYPDLNIVQRREVNVFA